MNDSVLGAPEAPFVPAAAPAAAPGLGAWVREGLRAAFLLRPRTTGQEPRPRALVTIAIVALLLDLVAGRFEIDGPADFNFALWLAGNWGIAACVLLVWALLWRPPGETGRQGSVASWFALWLVASIPPALVSQALGILAARELLPDALADSVLFAWGTYIGLTLWTLAIVVRLGRHFGLGRGRRVLLGAGFLLVFAITAWQFPDPAWDSPDDDDDAPELQVQPQSLQVQQEVFEHATRT
jgi:hypothetical protein